MPKDFNIAKTAGLCCKCEAQIVPGEQYYACVIQVEDGLQRRDFCLECFKEPPGEPAEDILAQWRTCAPQPQEKKKLFIDDELLLNFFDRLQDATEPAKVNFRCVLTLVLMRKKLLVYKRSDTTDDGEVWTLRLRGSDKTAQVLDPHMDEEKIAEVSRQLGEIMEGEL